MRDGNFAKHPLTHPGWFTFGPTIGKPPRLAFVASQHFFIARLPLLAVMQGGASRAIPTLTQTTRPHASNWARLFPKEVPDSDRTARARKF